MTARDGDGNYPTANEPIWIRKYAILRYCIGENAVEILDQFDFDEGNDKIRISHFSIRNQLNNKNCQVITSSY